MLFVVYPLAFIPVGLAFLARYAFGTQEAFYLVLAIDAIIGLIAYQVALDSAVKAADRLKETMLAALSVGDGPDRRMSSATRDRASQKLLRFEGE